MFLSASIHTNYPVISLSDRVSSVLQLMEDYDILHLPVVSDDAFSGIVSKDDLLDADQTGIIASIEYQLIRASAKENEHFLAAVKLLGEMNLSLLPVINEQKELVGVVLAADLLRQLAKFAGADEPGGLIVLEIEKRNYSLGELSRLVETNDASISQLNTTVEPETGTLIVTLRINKSEISDIVATFQRYEYVIRYYAGEEQYANEVKENYDHLMSYLNI